MKKYLEILRKVKIFSDFNDADILTLLSCLDANIVSYTKNSIVLNEYNYAQKIGIVLQGELQNSIFDFDGNQSIIATFSSGEIFAESLVCADVIKPSISILASKDTSVMYIDYNKILTVCKNTCDFHLKLIRNMLKILAQKNLYLNQKLSHITKRTTKEKTIAYLSDLSKQCGKKSFSIPYDRQGLANYLSVERTALSAELSKLRADGVLDFNKNTFTLK